MTSVRNRVFYQATIAGLTFDGIISADGPYIHPFQGLPALAWARTRAVAMWARAVAPST